MDHIKKVADAIHQKVGLERVISEYCRDQQLVGSTRDFQFALGTSMDVVVNRYLLPQDSGFALRDILPFIIVEPVDFDPRTAFWDRTSLFVAEQIMRTKHADVAVVAQDQERQYVSYEKLDAICTELKKLIGRDVLNGLAGSQLRHFSPRHSTTLAQSHMISLALAAAFDSKCQQFPCYECAGTPVHYFTGDPGETECPHPPSAEHRFVSVTQLPDNDQCCP